MVLTIVPGYLGDVTFRGGTQSTDLGVAQVHGLDLSRVKFG